MPFLTPRWASTRLQRSFSPTRLKAMPICPGDALATRRRTSASTTLRSPHLRRSYVSIASQSPTVIGRARSRSGGFSPSSAWVNLSMTRSATNVSTAAQAATTAWRKSGRSAFSEKLSLVIADPGGKTAKMSTLSMQSRSACRFLGSTQGVTELRSLLCAHPVDALVDQ